jgi:F-type H+-transporting ATPase subunit beta
MALLVPKIADGSLNHGVVVAVRGSVVDARFDEKLPQIFSMLKAGEDGRVVIEVMAQRDAQPPSGEVLISVSRLCKLPMGSRRV